MIYLILLLTSLILPFFVTSASYALTNATALMLGLALSYAFFTQKYSWGVGLEKNIKRQIRHKLHPQRCNYYYLPRLRPGMIIVRTESRLQMLPVKVYFDPAKNRRVM